ncbi:MAG TPA: hypothetical protein VF069_06315 [Streptosporangiaceae bacterium]
MPLSSTIPLIATIALALVGYLLTYMTNLRLARRKDRLDRINRQLSEFYGPLYALMEASSRAWSELLAKIGNPSSPRTIEFSPENISTWRLWMIQVFMPLNRQMMTIVTRHADLIEGHNFPKCLEDLCAHVVCYEPVLERWKQEGFDSLTVRDNASVIDFPRRQLEPYIKHIYVSLKREQEQLLKKTQ